MRASSITLLLATGLLAVAGCGSGDGANPSGGPSGAVPPLQNGSYQTPPPSYDRPASTAAPDDYEKPPSIYEKPGSGAGTTPPPGHADSTCELLCGMAVDQDCADDPGSQDEIQALPLNECIAACEAELSGIDCEAEYRRATSCIAAETNFNCRQLGEIQRGETPDVPRSALENCATDIDPLVSCREGPDTPPGNSGCNLVNDCQGCADECQRCRCNNLGDDGPCNTCGRD